MWRKDNGIKGILLYKSKMTLIATIATGKQSAKEVALLVKTVELFEPSASIFIFTDSETQPLLPTSSILKVQSFSTLNEYSGKTRSDMEALSGKMYPTLWHDFMIEKATAMKWIFQNEPEKAREGVWFLDADIALFAPLPRFEEKKTLALSPHFIRPTDERRYGHFNGGMVWLRKPDLLDIWRRATYSSRFFEQAALESVWDTCSEGERIEMPTQVNLGWWRHGQSVESPPEIEKKLGFQRVSGCMGLKYDDGVLQSVHTHWNEKSAFNAWIRTALQKIQKSHEPARKFLQALVSLGF